MLIGVPAFVFALWPLLARRGAAATPLPLAPDAREQLLERKRTALAALRELAFEHESGHVSDEDHAELRARYEAEAAEVLTALDRLGPPPASAPAPASAEGVSGARARGWRHPASVAVAGIGLVAFGVALGVGIVRYTAPDPTRGEPMTGSRPLAPTLEGATGTAMAGGTGGTDSPGTPPGLIAPEIMQRMLQAARESLFAGRYSDAIPAYQAVLKRDPRNVDAMTHLALIVAIGGHADQALQSLDRALAIDPGYPPALLYRGQILLEAKQDARGAVASWEKFVAAVPAGEERDRVLKLLADARTKAGAKK